MCCGDLVSLFVFLQYHVFPTRQANVWIKLTRNKSRVTAVDLLKRKMLVPKGDFANFPWEYTRRLEALAPM